MYKTVKLIKCGKFPNNKYQEIPWNKLCIYIIGPCNIHRKENNKSLILTSVKTADSIKRWFKITQYDEKCVITIMTLVETTYLTRFP